MKKEKSPYFIQIKKISDISYKEVFDNAERKLGIKTIYAITDKNEKLMDNSMYAGTLDARIIEKEIPDYINKIFFISGPHGMVNSFEKTLKSMGVKRKNIKIDFFPGFA